MPYSLPGRDKRTVIVGSTGSGKTFTACWLLAFTDWHLRPWYILDYKGDKLIRDLGAETISVNDPPPTEPGLYRLALIPDMDDAALSKFFWQVWENENAGIYLDEGFMINRNDSAFKALLTQGRSKNIQMITLVQRPVFCSKFIFSEANHFYVMKLQIEDDRKYVSGYLDGTPINRLPRFHSYWYNADDQEGAHIAPVPGRAAILKIFNDRRAQMAMERQKALEQFKSERFVAI
jgi:hypothetical protein